MSVDYNTIHKHLKQLKFVQGTNGVSGPANTLLDEPTSIKYISTLRQDLITLIAATTDSSQITSKTLNSIIILTKILDYVPKSDIIFTLFDGQLFRSLFDLLCLPNIPVEILRSVLRICLTYLAGVLPKTRKQGMFRVLLNVLCEPIKNTENLKCDLLFANLTSRITFADARMNLNIVDFVAKVLYRLMETIGSFNNDSTSLLLEEQWLLSIVRSLYVCNFFGVLSCIKGIDEIESMTGLRGSMDLTIKWLKDKNFDSRNIIWLECCTLTKEVGLILNENDILSKINDSKTIEISSLLSLIGALKQQKRSLKKILVECNMTSTLPILKFISIINDKITMNKSLNKIFGIWNTDLWFSLLIIGTRCWLFSGATEEAGDTDKIISMVITVLEWLGNQLSFENQINNSESFVSTAGINTDNNVSDYDVVSLLEKVDNFNYNEIKALQLNAINQTRSKKWFKELKPFEDLVHNQIIALVRDQRFLQLSKGSWVYASNPLESGNPRHYFLTLNSNSQSIVYKEFTKRPLRTIQAPNLDKDGIHIDFRNIIRIDSENLNPNISDTGLISIQSERMDVNKIEVITKNSAFLFYVDTKQLKDVWVDGLRILIADSKTDNNVTTLEPSPMKLSVSENFFTRIGVGEDIKKHVKTLQDVRIRTQLLDLDGSQESSSFIKDINLDSVNWNNLSVNFNYD
jgi:hypothetical protein